MGSFTSIDLDGCCSVRVGRLPDRLCPSGSEFEAWWGLRPGAPDHLTLYGRRVALPRLQRAYGHDYRFSRQTSLARPIPAALAPSLAWARRAVDPRMNGLLVNWYDAEQAHRIGPHRDSEVGLVPGCPIVTISFGSARTFRLRPYRGAGKVDLPIEDGSVVIIEWNTNQRWTHEVPHFARDRGRRISVTSRAFATDAAPG